MKLANDSEQFSRRMNGRVKTLQEIINTLIELKSHQVEMNADYPTLILLLAADLAPLLIPRSPSAGDQHKQAPCQNSDRQTRCDPV
jgi:hypothetical protein